MIAMMCAIMSIAQSIEIDGITYTGHKMGTYRYASISGTATENGENILSEVGIDGNTYEVIAIDSGSSGTPSLECNGESLLIPSTITTIGDYAFSGASFKNLTISENVQTIGSNIIYRSAIETLFFNAVNCRDFGSLCTEPTLVKKRINIQTGSISYPYSVSSNKLTSVIIGDNVEYIPSNFLNYNGEEKLGYGNTYEGYYHDAYLPTCMVKFVVVGKNVKEIGENAFCRASLYEEIHYNAIAPIDGSEARFPGEVKAVMVGEGVTRIPNYFLYKGRLYGYPEITEVTFPSSIKEIGRDAFTNAKIEKINVSADIFPKAFSFNKISEVTVSGCVSDSVFQGNSNIISISINGNIGNGAFGSTDNVKWVHLGENTKELGRQALGRLNNTSAIFVPAIPPVWKEESGFSNVYNNAVLLVPKGSREAYEQADVWKNFKFIIETDLDSGEDSDGQVRLSTSISDNIAVQHSTHRRGETAIVEVHPPAGWHIGKAEFNGDDVLGDFDGGIYVTRPLSADSQMNVELACDSPFEIVDTTTGLSPLPDSEIKIGRDGDLLTIYGLSQGDTVTFYSLSGMKLLEHTASGESISINTSGRDSGVYVISINGQGYKVRI